MGQPCWEALRRLLDSEPLATLSALAARHDGLVALVGGALRDALLGLPVADLDLVVESRQGEFHDAIALAFGRRPVAIGDAFQDTHRLHQRGTQIDIARTLGTLPEDLGRRDFTINAMALPLPASLPPEDALVDPFHGLDDLRARVVRMASAEALRQDPVRLMRAVRYAAVLPGFHLHADTEAQVAEGVANLATVARERVQYEFGRILVAGAWAGGVELAKRTGLLEATLGRAPALRWVAAAADDADVIVRLGALLMDIGAPEDDLRRRLEAWRWPHRQARDASRVATWAAVAPAAEVGTHALWALQEPDNLARVAALLRHGTLTTPPLAEETTPAQLEVLVRRAREPRWVTGADLRSWGIPPGPELGAALRSVAVGQLLRRWPDAGAGRRWVRERLHAGEAP